MKNILRILYILLFVIAGIWVFLHPVKTETNLLRAVYSNSYSDEIVVTLSGRYSSKINVLIESSSVQSASQTADKFLNSIDKKSFMIKDFDFSKILSTLQIYNQNLLSASTAKELENKQYDAVTVQAYYRLLDPFGIMLLPLNEDQIVLFGDYLKYL